MLITKVLEKVPSNQNLELIKRKVKFQILLTQNPKYHKRKKILLMKMILLQPREKWVAFQIHFEQINKKKITNKNHSAKEDLLWMPRIQKGFLSINKILLKTLLKIMHTKIQNSLPIPMTEIKRSKKTLINLMINFLCKVRKKVFKGLIFLILWMQVGKKVKM